MHSVTLPKTDVTHVQQFGEHKVRYAERGGTPWIVARDLAAPMQVGDTAIANHVAGVPAEHRALILTESLSGVQKTVLVSPVAATFILARGRSEASKTLAWQMAELWVRTRGPALDHITRVFGDDPRVNHVSAGRLIANDRRKCGAATEADWIALGGPERVRARYAALRSAETAKHVRRVLTH